HPVVPALAALPPLPSPPPVYPQHLLLPRAPPGLPPPPAAHRLPDRAATPPRLPSPLRPRGALSPAPPQPAHLSRGRRYALHLALPDSQGRRDGPDHARPPQLPAQAVDPPRALRLRVPQHGQHPHGRPRELLRPLREPPPHGTAPRGGAPRA